MDLFRPVTKTFFLFRSMDRELWKSGAQTHFVRLVTLNPWHTATRTHLSYR